MESKARRKHCKTVLKAIAALFVVLPISSCGKHSVQSSLNRIYQTDFFSESWSVVYSALPRGSFNFNYYVFDIGEESVDLSSFTAEKDDYFEETYFHYFLELGERATVPDEFCFRLDKPYSWLWKYGGGEMFSYASTREKWHVEKELLGAILVAFCEEDYRVYVLENDYH